MPKKKELIKSTTDARRHIKKAENVEIRGDLLIESLVDFRPIKNAVMNLKGTIVEVVKVQPDLMTYSEFKTNCITLLKLLDKTETGTLPSDKVHAHFGGY
jgi:hypothetical protein